MPAIGYNPGLAFSAAATGSTPTAPCITLAIHHRATVAGGSNAARVNFDLGAMAGSASQYSVGIEQFILGCYNLDPAIYESRYQAVGYFRVASTLIEADDDLTGLGLAVDFAGCERLGPCSSKTYDGIALGKPDADRYRYFEWPKWRDPRQAGGGLNLTILVTLRSSAVDGADVPSNYEIFFDNLSVKVFAGTHQKELAIAKCQVENLGKIWTTQGPCSIGLLNRV
ncbi:hypothetical protein PG987_007583 [Apiospora arundinis]